MAKLLHHLRQAHDLLTAGGYLSAREELKFALSEANRLNLPMHKARILSALANLKDRR